MDMSRMSQGQMIAGVGGVVLIVSLFLSWFSGFSVATGIGTVSSSASAFDYFSGMDIIMLIVGIAAIAWAVSGAGGFSLPAHSGWIVALLGVAMVGFTLGVVLEYSNAGIGAWLGFVSTIAITYGAFSASANPAPKAARPATPATPPTPPPAAPTA